jgi:hypothetical protein
MLYSCVLDAKNQNAQKARTDMDPRNVSLNPLIRSQSWLVGYIYDRFKPHGVTASLHWIETGECCRIVCRGKRLEVMPDFAQRCSDEQLEHVLAQAEAHIKGEPNDFQRAKSTYIYQANYVCECPSCSYKTTRMRVGGKRTSPRCPNCVDATLSSRPLTREEIELREAYHGPRRAKGTNESTN